MKKLIALVCALCLLVAAVPAMAVDFDMGALADLFTMDEETEESAEKDIEQMFEGETMPVDLAGETVEVHVNFKEAMDSYLAFLDEYANYLSDPVQNADSGVRMWLRYTELLDVLDELDEDESEMSAGDMAYYLYILSSITAKLETIE